LAVSLLLAVLASNDLGVVPDQAQIDWVLAFG
jgi:hypothetical protein